MAFYENGPGSSSIGGGHGEQGAGGFVADLDFSGDGGQGGGVGMSFGNSEGAFARQQKPIGGGPVSNSNNLPPLDHEQMAMIGTLRHELEFLEAGGSHCVEAVRLLKKEIERIENHAEADFLEVDISKPIKLVKKIWIPVDRHPQFNFVGKVLGVSGATMKQISSENKCRVMVCGKGSTKNPAREQELFMSGDPRYEHYAGPLHVYVETLAPPPLAYRRVSKVVDLLAALLSPESDYDLYERVRAGEQVTFPYEQQRFVQQSQYGGGGGGGGRGGFGGRGGVIGRGRGGAPRGGGRGMSGMARGRGGGGGGAFGGGKMGRGGGGPFQQGRPAPY